MQNVLPEASLGDTKLQDSSATDQAAIDAVQGKGAGGSMSLVDTAGSNIKAGESSSTSYEAMQTNGNTTGEAINAVGTTLNKVHTVVTNVSNVTNSESSQVSSTSHSSNVVTFDAAKYRSSMRARYA